MNSFIVVPYRMKIYWHTKLKMIKFMELILLNMKAIIDIKE